MNPPPTSPGPCEPETPWRPPPGASFPLGSAPGRTPRPDRPRLPPHPGAGNAAAGARGPAQAAPLVAASLPHLNRPRPSPQGPARGRAAATGLHNPGRGEGRPRGGGLRQPPARLGVRGDGQRGARVTRLRCSECPEAPFPLRSSVGQSR